MHSLDLPAGATIRFTASARPDVGLHRWDMRVFAAGAPADGAAPRLTYGSQIGGRDCEQRIDVPVQDKDCRVEVTSRHAVAGGWADNRALVDDDTPGLLVIGFSNPSSPPAQMQDVTLNFAFKGVVRPDEAGRG